MAFDCFGLLTHNQLRTTRHTIAIPHLPAGLEGLRVVQISDLHIYQHTDFGFYEDVARQVNAMAADILVMTGDIIHYGPDHVAAAGEFLAQLKARLGKYACMGNHDYYDEAGGEGILAMLKACGFETLVNRSLPIEDNGNRLWMTGVDDIKYGRPDIPKALDFASGEDEPVLMLAHNPLTLDPVAYYPEKTVHLMLSGHTHAGHVYLPFLDPVYRSWFKLKYRYGYYQTGDTQLYLTSGLGSAALYYYGEGLSMACPRFRFNTWPEIVEITLSAQS